MVEAAGITGSFIQVYDLYANFYVPTDEMAEFPIKLYYSKGACCE